MCAFPTNKTIMVYSTRMIIRRMRLSDIWPTIASIALWNIWKSRYKVGLVGEESRPKETITALWYDLITNIWAQYEELEGSSNMVEVARLSFQHSSSYSPFCGLCRCHANVVLHHAKMVISSLGAQLGRYMVFFLNLTYCRWLTHTGIILLNVYDDICVVHIGV